MTDQIVRAPAKINLGLEVLRRREDGFHDVNTVFAAVDVFDTLRMGPTDGAIECVVTGSIGLDGGPGNLASRAASALRERLNHSDGVRIELLKEIPIGAGLGGGSSDAAAVLLGAPRCWGEHPPSSLLASLALDLGSDVPFFLDPRPSVASSRGEALRPLSVVLPWAVLLVNAGIHIPTGWAYNALNRRSPREPTDLAGVLEAAVAAPALLRAHIVNDFEPVVFAAHPDLADIKESLYAAGAVFALMSGSGSTIYGLYTDAGLAQAASARFPYAWTRVCRFVTTLSS